MKVGKETCCVEPAFEPEAVEFSVISRFQVTREGLQLTFEGTTV